MRKSILIGTREDVINVGLARTVKGDLNGLPTIKQSVNASVSHCPSIGAYPSVVVPIKVRRIETFNHPSLMDSQ